MKDIQNRNDLESIIKAFYDKLLEDEEFKHIFLQVAAVDMEKHLPIIVDFWESSLFQTNNYKRNTLKKHLDLHNTYGLAATHFEKWLDLFNNTVDQHYSGSLASKMKVKALSVGTVIQIKIKNLEKGNTLV